jgi:6-phosphogluconolactonase (cycloisomerase 2 family)
MRRCLLVVLLCLLAPIASAAAASPPGTLAQIGGAGGCVSQQTTLGCTVANGLDDARAIALSPDGKTLYAVASTAASVTSFSVDPRNGLLQQLNLSAGCLSSAVQTGCGAARTLTGAAAVAVSPDGLHVYVAAAADGAVDSFARQPNGSLQQLSGIAGCSTTTITPGCDSAPALAGADAIAISSDGRFVYAAGASADSLVIFVRDAASGRLQPLTGPAGCLRAARAGCAPVVGLDSPSAIAISPDGTSLYVTSSGGTLTSFTRDPATGRLTQQAGTGCFSNLAVDGCTAIGGLARASGVAVSPDGHVVLVAATDGDSVSSFLRDPASGALARVSCAAGTTATAGCVPALVLGPRSLTFRPDGRVVWVASSRGDAIVTLQLDPATGALTATPGPGGCLRAQASLDCRATRALDDPRGLVASADGRHVFAVSTGSDGIAVLGQQVAPNCLAVRTRTKANRQHSVVLACSDPNGDKITLAIGRKPKHGKLGPLGASKGSVRYTPAAGYTGPDSFTYTASDGMDVSAPGTATVSVTLPTRAPAVRIRTARTHLVRGAGVHVLVECPPEAIGPCRVAAHLVVNGRPAGYGFARIARLTTGRVVVSATGLSARTKARVVVTVRDRTRRATVSQRAILILP